MPEYVRRTAITRISPSSSQAVHLEETIDDWLQGCNLAATVGQLVNTTTKSELQSAAYDAIRHQTELGSQHAILAVRAAAQALGSVKELRQDGRSASEPEFTSPTVKYDARTLTVFPQSEEISLTTTDGRIRCGLDLPSDSDGFQWQYLESEDWELTESTLTVRDGDYFVHLGFRKPEVTEHRLEDTAEDRTVLGVDLGIENLAVTSTPHFESGRELLHTHKEFERVRCGLQRTGTQSAHRTLVGLGAREERYTCSELHRISKAIVSEAVNHGCDVIAFEDLRHIQDKMPSIRKFKQWAYCCLVEYVRYKTEIHPIEVVFVDPEDTSRRCFECGHINARNRTKRDHFHCQSCGATANADYNAAKYIGWRYVRRGHQSSRWTGDRQLALKSGTVRPNQGFIPSPTSGIEAESTDKLHATKSKGHTPSE